MLWLAPSLLVQFLIYKQTLLNNLSQVEQNMCSLRGRLASKYNSLHIFSQNCPIRTRLLSQIWILEPLLWRRQWRDYWVEIERWGGISLQQEESRSSKRGGRPLIWQKWPISDARHLERPLKTYQLICRMDTLFLIFCTEEKTFCAILNHFIWLIFYLTRANYCFLQFFLTSLSYKWGAGSNITIPLIHQH